jgi:putative tricarboxylic transport membrane protein
MTLNRDALATLFLFVLFATYGFLALQIDVFPGQETEPFKPRTLPFALAICGMCLSVIRCLQALRQPADAQRAWRSYDWRRAGLLCVNMIVYGFLFTRMGFLIATALFLAMGFVVLGERRFVVLCTLPAIFAGVFWLLATKLLGLYLAPGTWLPGNGA